MTSAHSGPPGPPWPPDHAGTGAGPDTGDAHDPDRLGGSGLLVGAGRRARRVALTLSGVLVTLGVLAVAGLTMLVVWTHLGQRADERSRWSVAVPDQLRELIVAWLDVVSVGFIVAVLAVVVAVALLLRRVGAALCALVAVAGANITTQALKELIPRPEYGVGPAINSLPSGHTTVMTSLALAVLVVAPRPLRPLLVLVTSAIATFTGAATILERWHRPSDVIAAFGVCGVWFGLVLGVRALAAGRRAAPTLPPSRRPDRLGLRAVAHLVAGVLGALAIGVLLVVGGLVAHGTPSNVLVGAVMLTATGLTGALLAALVGAAADALDSARADRS